ncbi:MAG: ATP-binding protein [Bacteroidota bacterium]
MQRPLIFLVVFLFSFAAGLVLNGTFKKQQKTKIDKESFISTLFSKQELINGHLSDIVHKISEEGLDETASTFYSDYSDLFHSQGLAFYVFYNDQLQYWNTNAIPVSALDSVRDHSVNRLGNGWYYIRKEQADSFHLVSLALIKKHYSYENQYLKNTFQEDFSLPSSVNIVKDPDQETVIRDREGEYLFSLYPSRFERGDSFMFYFSVVLMLAALVFLFLFLGKLFQQNLSFKKKVWLYAMVVVLLSGIRLFSVQFQFPGNLYQLEVFDPSFYASSAVIPSLGDLLLHLVCLWFVIWLASRYLRPVGRFFTRSNMAPAGISVLCSLINIGFFGLIYYLFRSLIFNSSFSFDFQRFFELELSGLLMLLSIFILFFIYFLWIDFFIYKISKLITYKKFAGIFIPLSLGALGMAYHYGLSLQWYTITFFYVTHLIVALIAYFDTTYNYPRLIVIMLISVVFAMFFIHHNTDLKEREKRKILVTNLESERDRVGELLLRRRADRVASDGQIAQWMIHHLDNEKKILEYLRNKYFDGYFNKYDLQVSVCSPNDDLSVLQDNRTNQHHCYTFFDQMLQEEGVTIGNSRFYYLDNLNGRISYIGLIKYHETDQYQESTLYISLDSKLTSGQLGYPELLLTGELIEPGPLQNYSYAKYKYDDLIRRSGEYSYPLKLTHQFETDGEYNFMDYQGYSHLTYNNAEEGSVIVISKPLNEFLDFLAQFSYIFAFFYLLTLLFIFIFGLPENISQFSYNFKNKIKISMVLILILSLIAVGTGTVYYTTRQFQKQQKENISEKMESLIVELEDKLGSEDTLTHEYSGYINNLLTKFSDVFYVDMNLYNLEGELLASSRSQVFEKHLVSRQMNPVAYEKMSHDKLPQFIHNEWIGNMRYHSAYVPFYNNQNQLLAYLNIPYFTRQQALQEEIYTIIMVMVNIYVFLIILGTVVAVLISNTITRPLRLIQQKLGRIGLDKTNEKINYESHDEIGELVSEYNRMIDELEANAEKLAQSEREMAWREMAKQIAHEIKNPLTPMKLKVQYLKRAWDDRVENFDERMQRFADSMISQINTLSEIASEFSNFAKMPRARNRKLDVNQQIDAAVHLFEHTENIEIIREDYVEAPLYIYADKDQISRVFSNLIKNSIQAIPAHKEGRIRIGVSRKDGKVLVTIADNGCGVPGELRGKLFRPSFTTKSGGMGMGLAISKKIVEDLGGSITYKTEKDRGTTFYIEIPEYENA